MKHPLESSLMTAAGILLMALLQLAAARPFLLRWRKNWSGSFILWIQTCFILCCFVYGFLLLGALEYYVVPLYLAALVFAGRLNISMRTAMLSLR